MPKGKNTKTGKKKKAPGPAGTVEMHEVALQEEGEMVHMEQEETHQENNCVVITGTSIYNSWNTFVRLSIIENNLHP